MNPKKILVPIDFSETSLAALGAAKVIAKRFGSEVILLYAVDLVIPEEVAGSAAARVHDAHRREAQQRLERVEKDLARHGVEYRSRFVKGHPAQAILDAAQKSKVGLIVMGTHGAGGFTRMVVGSVADKVMRTASCPVLTVRSDGKAPKRARSRRAA